MEITWLGHGTFQFRLPSGQVIVMDPWTEGNPAYPPGHQIPRVANPVRGFGFPQCRKSGHNSDMEITWLGHGTFQFRLPSGQVIVMDPWTEGNPAYPPGHQIPRVDTICIS